MIASSAARWLIAALIIAAASAAAPSQASAQTCSFSVSNLNFGTVNLTGNSPIDATATYSASCSGGTPGQTLLLCPNFGAGSGGAGSNNSPRYLLSGATQLAFNVFSNPGHSSVWGSAIEGGNAPPILLTLNGSGAATQGGTVYGRISAGQQLLPSGNYTSAFSGVPNASLSWDVYGGGNCASVGSSNETSISFTASASYPEACTVSTGTMDFGSMMDITGAIDTSAGLNTTCTNATPYAISLGDGLSPSAPLQRRMSSGTNRLAYGLYQDSSRLSAWGSGANAVQATGTGLPQSQTVFGRIPMQVLPPPGAYSDTVVVTVSY